MIRPIDSEFEPAGEHGVILASCGYEERSSYLCRLGISGERKISARYRPTGSPREEENFDTYLDSGWEVMLSTDAIETAFATAAESASKLLTVDISSMPRKVLASIVERAWMGNFEEPRLRFLYCPGDFEHSLIAAQKDLNLTAAPVSPFFEGVPRPTSTPIGLVVGLGLEQHRALGLVELLEPARSWIFSSHGADDRYKSATAAAHRELLATFDSGSVFEYDLRSLESTYYSLESLAFAAKSSFRLILAPSGPKLFALACMLVGAPRELERPAVWRVGGSESTPPTDVKETGTVVSADIEVTRPAQPSAEDQASRA